MKLRSTLLLCLLFLSAPLYAADQSIVKIQTWQTLNGAHVYFVNAPQIPMVDVRVVFAAGSAYDGKQWGIAAFANAMLNEGTTEHNANQIAAAFDRVGAQVGGGVDRDKAVISLRSLTAIKYLNPAMKTFVEIITQANFPAHAFQRVKSQTLAAIQQTWQQPSSIASNAFYRDVYQNNPYAHPSMGTLNSIKALTPEAARSFYAKYYVAGNADVIIVGDVTKDQAKTIAQQAVGSLPRGHHAPTLKKANDTTAGGYRFIKFPAQQHTIIIGQVGIARRDRDYFPLMVGNRILGGLPLTSLLFEQVRNQRGLAYSVQSQFIPLQYRGPFMIALQTRADKAQDALRVVQQVLRHYIENGPTAAQVNAAQRNLLGSFPLKIDTNSDIAGNVANIAFYHLPLNYLDAYRDHIKAVTATQIKDALQQVVHPQAMKIVVVGTPNKQK